MSRMMMKKDTLSYFEVLSPNLLLKFLDYAYFKRYYDLKFLHFVHFPFIY